MHPIIRLATCALALTACAPTTAPTPGASTPIGSPAPAPSGATTPTPAATASGATAAPTGPAVANTGKFAWGPNQSPRFYATNPASIEAATSYVTFKTGDVKDGFIGFEVLRAPTLDRAPGGQIASGVFPVADQNPYWCFIDVNFRNPEIWASALVEGEDTITVPAGTFVCTRTKYEKKLSDTATFKTTLWINGTAGLVQAKVTSFVVFGATTQAANTTLALEKLP